jgi:hypothetical protein|nr:MAG TPA: hypothetical protein [Caudoviricetes sp.]
MNKNNHQLSLKSKLLSTAKERTKKSIFAEKFLDIDFFYSQKARISADIKARNELRELNLNKTQINKLKQTLSNQRH